MTYFLYFFINFRSSRPSKIAKWVQPNDPHWILMLKIGISTLLRRPPLTAKTYEMGVATGTVLSTKMCHILRLSFRFKPQPIESCSSAVPRQKKIKAFASVDLFLLGCNIKRCPLHVKSVYESISNTAKLQGRISLTFIRIFCSIKPVAFFNSAEAHYKTNTPLPKFVHTPRATSMASCLFALRTRPSNQDSMPSTH